MRFDSCLLTLFNQMKMKWDLNSLLLRSELKTRKLSSSILLSSIIGELNVGTSCHKELGRQRNEYQQMISQSPAFVFDVGEGEDFCAHRVIIKKLITIINLTGPLIEILSIKATLGKFGMRSEQQFFLSTSIKGNSSSMCNVSAMNINHLRNALV